MILAPGIVEYKITLSSIGLSAPSCNRFSVDEGPDVLIFYAYRYSNELGKVAEI